MTDTLSMTETFEGKEIRAIEHQGELWMPIVDLAGAWGIKPNTLYQQISRNTKKFDGFVSDVHVTCTPPEEESWHKAVNEQGLYLLMGSINTDRLKNKKAAEKILKFQRWVPELIKKYRKNEMQVQSKIVPVTEPAAPMAPARWSEAAIQCLDFAKALQQSNPQLDPGMVMAIGIREAERKTGQDLSAYKKLIPPSPAAMQEEYITATQIGYIVGRTAKEVNKYLERWGYLYQSDDGTWYLTNAGAEYGKVFPGAFDSGHNGYYIKWRRAIIAVSRMKENSPHRIRD